LSGAREKHEGWVHMSFNVGRELLLCPIDGTPTVVIGSGDFVFKCNSCGNQFRIDGTIFVPGVQQAPPFVMPQNFIGDQSEPNGPIDA
jgi:hypothetical protein